MLVFITLKSLYIYISLAGECAPVKLCDDDSSSNEVLPDMEVKDGLEKAKDLTGDFGKQLSNSTYSPFF